MKRHVSGGDTGAWATLASVTGGRARRWVARSRGLLAHGRVPAAGPLFGRLRVPAVSLLLALTLLVGPGGPLAAGVGIGPDLAHAQPHGDKIRPNRYGATEGSRSVVHRPPRGTSANAPAGGSIPCGGSNTAGTNTAAAYTQSYTYDTLGRLTTGPLGSYTYGDGAHVHAATAVGPNGTPTWTGAYDAAGDLTCRAPSSATTCAGTPTGQALGYDAEGRLANWANAQTSPTATASYLYDGEGTRVEAVTTQSGTTTSTVYLGNTEEVATSGGTTTTTTYYYAGSLRIALAVNGVISYLATDLLGSGSVALAANGTTTAAQLYAPYGGVRYASGTLPTDYGFTGQRSDAASTGLDYYVSRYYDPVVGQFISPDSTLSQNGYNPWGLSRYAYVQGNPETLADPDGHCWPVCTMIIGALVGAAIGAGISIVTQAASGHSINWGEIGTQAAVGAVSGAIAGLAGPEAGPLGGLAAHALIGAASGAAGQLVNIAMEHKPLGDGVLLAAAIGLGESESRAHLFERVRGDVGVQCEQDGLIRRTQCNQQILAQRPMARFQCHPH